jgi:PAS domain S-box-containing protein
MSSLKSQAPSDSRALLPHWLTGPWGIVGVITILYNLINIAWTYFHWGGPERVTLIANLFSFFPSLAAAAVAWRVAGEKKFSPPVRRAWFTLGVSFLMFLIGNAIWAYLEVVLGIEPFPSIADVFYLAFYPLGLWGLLSIPSAPQNPRERLTLWLDLLCVLTAAAMFVGNFIILPTAAVSSNDLLTQLIAPAYPIGSLLLIGGILAVLYRPASPNTQSALSLLLIGMMFFVSGDFSFGYTSLTGTYTIGGWTDTAWNVAQLFFVLAALRQMYHGPASAAPHGRPARLGKPGRWLSLVAVALGYGLALYVVIVNSAPATEWLMAGALLLTLLVIARQMVSPTFANLPIRTKLILTLILVSGLSISLVAFASYLTIRSNLQTAVEDNLEAHAQNRAEAIVGLLSKQSDALEGFVLSKALQDAAAAASASYATEDSAMIREQLRQRDLAWRTAADSAALIRDLLNNEASEELHEFQDNFPGFTDLVLADKYGAALAATTRPANYDQSMLGWWEAAFHEGQGAIHISQPILEQGAESHHIVIVMPVRSHLHSDLVGMLIATYSLKHMAEMLVSESPGDMSEDSILLPTSQMLTSDGHFVLIEQSTLEGLRAMADADSVLMNFEGKPQLVSQAAVTSFDFDPEEALAFDALNWKLIAHQDPAEAFRPLNAAWRTTLLTTLVVLLLTTGLAVLLAQGLVAPISRLTTVTRQIGAGNISTKAPVESHDEIGTLAVAFNTMLDALTQTQQELQESESLYRSLVDYSPDMIVVHSEGRVLFINPAGVELLRAPNAEEFVGQPTMSLIPRADQEDAKEALENITATGEPSPLLQRKMQRLDGTTFDAEFRAIPISYAGQPAIQFVMRDITERKEAEEKIHQLLMEVGRQRGDLERRVAQRTEELNTLNLRLQDELEERQRLVQSLQESEERFRLVFDTSPDAIFLLDPHDSAVIWKIVDCNPSACQMNGYTREELIGQSIDILNADKGGPEGFAYTLKRLQSELMLRGIEATHIHKDGYVFPIEYSTSLITIDGRELVLGIDRDITERKQAEEALRQTKEMAEQASRAKSEFLSRMSHELRTPMNAILGFAQLLTMSQKDPLTPTQKERVKQIVKGGEHLLGLINEILDISRIEAGRVQISPEPVSIRESIQEALDLTAPLAANRNIQIQISLGADANPYVMADRQRLKQVLLNLLNNAVKYNRPGGFVALTCEATRSEREAWHISVTDTGPGISPENLRLLFTPFERLSADQTNVEGTGLGLALARRLVELMKGRMGVESIVGQGSTFWIELPAAESQLDRLQRTGGTSQLTGMFASGAPRTILYIEDNIANFELIQQVLADYGQIELLWGTGAETGFRLAHEHHPDLILLDLHLGGRDGGEVLRRLKEDDQTASIPVVMVSADATPGQIERLLALGAQSYLTKPLDIKLFIQLIDELLSEKRG